jgi:hypothetical protein
MIRLLFFLRFRSQLRRTDHQLVDDLEEGVLEFIRKAGGVEKNERRYIGALFQDSALALGLDIFSCAGGILNLMEQNAGRLYGYALIAGRDLDEAQAGRLCGLCSSPRNSGLYCDGELRDLLGFYLRFEAPGARVPLNDYARAESFKGPEDFARLRPSGAAGERLEELEKSLKQGRRKNTFILGPEYSEKRAGLYRFCAAGAPPLVIRFDSPSGGLAALSDAYSPAIRAFLAEPAELEEPWESLFRDRLHGETPPLLLRRGRRFLALLLEAYLDAASARGLRAVLILEELDRAPESAARIVREALEFYALRPGKTGFSLYATAAACPPGWDRFFHHFIRVEGEAPPCPELSRDLWEIAYAFALLGRYVPGPLLPRLAAEGGKSPETISLALEMLIALGLADSPQDPRPRIPQFLSRAEAVLGGRKELVRGMVRDRLLHWVFSGRLRPCFALLTALADLGDGAGIFKSIPRGDELILLSVLTDMTNGISSGIREALEGGRLETIVGPERAFTVAYLYGILKALLNGNDAEIREAFRDAPDESRIYPPFRAQALVNTAAYQLGIRDLDSALGSIKTAFVLSQNAPWTGLAQSNRLFSLVNLAKQRMGETVDYAGFAVEHAEKTSGSGELALASYYAAVVQTLYGNLSRAERLSASAEEQALAAGRVEWADRARFFRGKLAFELGRYQDALLIFRGIVEDPLGNPTAEKLSLLEAWAYRARIYSQDFLLARPPGGGPDADLFEIEGACLAGDYGRAVDLSAALAESLPGDAFIHTEQPDWRSGFAQCELLLLPGRVFWDRMVLVYRALALCRLSAAGGAEALRIMQRVLRDERLSEMDPCDAFYFYAWYQVLQESGAPQVDMNTAVSMAFKRLQRRATRIDDASVRRAYLTQPHWNSALSLAAREHKLI